MPTHGIPEVGQGVRLPPELLRVVFAQVAGSASDQRPDPFGRTALRHGHQADGIGGPTRSPRRFGDAASDTLDIGSNPFRVHGSSAPWSPRRPRIGSLSLVPDV